MKKVFILLTIIIISMGCATCSFSQAGKTSAPQSQSVQNARREALKKQFEERLGLTKKQKEQAKKIHDSGFEEMKPIMMELGLKHQEMESLSLTISDNNKRNIRREQLKKEINDLEKQANDIRKKNSLEFEKLLTKNQKEILEQMKAEGRQRFEKQHQARPVFPGLGSQNLFFKPMP